MRPRLLAASSARLLAAARAALAGRWLRRERRQSVRDVTRGLLTIAACAILGACHGDGGKAPRDATTPPIVPPTASTPASPATESRNLGALPAFVPGIWSRDWIERRGQRTNTMTVRYLQTLGAFGDVRIPIDRPDFSRARSFDDLSDAELRALGGQRGFTGNATANGDVVTWHHEIDYQPDTSRDAGRLTRIGDNGMLETGLDSSYRERYRSLGQPENRFLALRVERGGRLEQALLIVGDWFYYARNRARDLPPAESLERLIATKHPTRTQLVAWLDCELSAGRIAGGSTPWRIESSTLPWREGQRLTFIDRIHADPVSGALAWTAAPGESWTLTQRSMLAPALARLFPGTGASAP